MTRLVLLAIGAAVCVVLAACAYKPVKAPCGPDEDATALAYAEGARTARSGGPFPGLDGCGPMRPI